MDIQEWLSETVLPPQAPSPRRPGGEDQVSCSRGSERAPTNRHRKYQDRSDSSLLDAPRSKHMKPGRVPCIEQEADKFGRIDAAHPKSRSERSTSSEPYRRKSRRKTRPGRYESTSKDARERGTHAQRRGMDESNKERRKSRRIKTNKPGSGIVENFQAKNVSQDRLTLKPADKLGLFNKGKASSPVKGRGLPDLVFSEMSFLNKHKASVEDKSLAELPKRRKENQACDIEKGISKYFTPVRPTLADQELRILVSPSQKIRQDVHRSPQKPLVTCEIPVPTVEPADQASSLAFGEKENEGGSQISWSDSARVPSATPIRVRIEASQGNGQRNSTRVGEKKASTEGGETLHSPPTRPVIAKHLVGGSNERFQLSSLPSTLGRTSSSRCNELMDESKRRLAPNNVPPSSSMLQLPRPSVSQDSGLCTHLGSSRQPRGVHADLEIIHLTHGELDKQTSSSLGEILQECNTAFHNNHVAVAIQAMGVPSYSTPAHGNPGQTLELYPTINRIPSVRFAGVEEVYHNTAQTTSEPNTYDEQHVQSYGNADRISLEGEDLALSLAIQDDHLNEGSYWGSEQDFDENADLVACDIGLDSCDNDEGMQQTYCRTEEDARGQGSSVVKPGFWRPHKLY